MPSEQLPTKYPYRVTLNVLFKYTVSQKKSHHTLVHIFTKYWPIFFYFTATLSRKFAMKLSLKIQSCLNPYSSNGEWNASQCGFCRKSSRKQRSGTAIFCEFVTNPWAYRCNSEYHYICFLFYVAGFDLTSKWLVLRLPAFSAYEAKV